MMQRWWVVVYVLLVFGITSHAQISEPEGLVNDPAFDALAEYSARTNHDALLVYRDGVLVYETYRLGYDPNEAHVLFSGTKSFACALAVRAQMDGLLTLDEPVVQTLTEWADDPQRQTMTIRQVLQLISGLNGDQFSFRALRRYDAVDLAINDSELLGDPATVFSYGGVPFFVFGEILARKLDVPLLDYLQSTVFDPLDISVRMDTDGAGHIDLAAGGNTTAREWARYGQLILQDGVWDGVTLLDGTLLDECFIASAPNVHYGMTWWLMHDLTQPTDINVTAPVPDTADDGIVLGETVPQALVAGGALDQRLIILPEYHVVVVRLAGGSLRYSDAELMRRLVTALAP